nr:hypothetical protein [uncultured Mediterraneibacter sp.]
MTGGIFLRVFLIVLGCYLLVITLLSLAKRKMTEQFCLVWSVLSVLMVILGIVIKPSQIERYMRGEILALVLIVVLGVVWGLWFISTQVSILMRKNQELAMQTSLLNQDSENMLRQIDLLKAEIEVLKKRNETEENSR